MQYEKLFSEGRIGSVTIKNRVVMPPMEVGMANPDGTPSEQLIAYYEERARNGLGLLITGITRVNGRHGATLPRQLAMTGDRHIEPFARMVERVHAHGTKIFCQLHHPGRLWKSLMRAHLGDYEELEARLNKKSLSLSHGTAFRG